MSPKFFVPWDSPGAGPLFWQDPPQQFIRRLILVMWNLNDLPVLVASETHAKKLKPIPARCASETIKWSAELSNHDTALSIGMVTYDILPMTRVRRD